MGERAGVAPPLLSPFLHPLHTSSHFAACLHPSLPPAPAAALQEEEEEAAQLGSSSSEGEEGGGGVLSEKLLPIRQKAYRVPVCLEQEGSSKLSCQVNCMYSNCMEGRWMCMGGHGLKLQQ